MYWRPFTIYVIGEPPIDPGKGMLAIGWPVFLSSTWRTAPLPQPSLMKRRVLVAITAGRVNAPVVGMSRPWSAGLVLMATGVSPPGTIHTWSPVLRLMAVTRLYGGFINGSPFTVGV